MDLSGMCVWPRVHCENLAVFCIRAVDSFDSIFMLCRLHPQACGKEVRMALALKKTLILLPQMKRSSSLSRLEFKQTIALNTAHHMQVAPYSHQRVASGCRFVICFTTIHGRNRRGGATLPGLRRRVDPLEKIWHLRASSSKLALLPSPVHIRSCSTSLHLPCQKILPPTSPPAFGQTTSYESKLQAFLLSLSASQTQAPH